MERFNSYQNIKTELDKYDDFAPGNLNSEKVEKLIYNFKSEQKEKWVAAAQKIGELAAKGSNQLKDFIEEKLTYSVNINQQIHAFTALGSYYGYCKKPSQEEFEILNQYRDSREEGSYVQKKKKIKLDKFFDNIFKNYNMYSELTAKVDKETDSNQLEKIKEIEEEYIEDIVIDDWHLNSLVYVLDIIANKRDDIIGFLRGLIRRSHYNNIFIFNLPYLFLKIANEKENNIKKYQPLAKLILDNIEKNNIDFSESSHYFSIFYLDLIDFLNIIYPEKNKYFNIDFYLELPSKVANKYNSLCHSEEKDEYAVRRMIEYVKSYFKEEFAWKALPDKTKNIFLIFDLLIKDLNNGLNIKDKILLVLEEKDEWLNKNDRLIDGFVRELKFLYFKRLDNKENYSQEVEFQVYSVIDLVQNWNWSSLADKDIASIIINAFDILWFKGDKVERENFFKLFYTIFSQIPDGKIIEEMLEYCKNESLKDIIKIYLKAYRITDQDSPEFINYFQSLRDKIKSEDKIPDDVKELYDYIFSEKLSLNRKTGKETVNVFDIDTIIKLYGFKEESRLHDINVSEMYEFEPLQKYILKPIFKYKFIMEGDFLFDLYSGYGSARSEENLIKELQTQVKLKSDKFIGQLKEVMDYLEFYKDDYLSAFKNEKDLSIIDDLGREILENLDEYQKLVGYFSFLERDFIRTTILQAKSIIFEDSRYVSEISVALQNGNENRLINILNKEIGKWRINKRLRERYENIIYKYFLERGMFKEYNKQMVQRSEKISPTRILARFNNILMNYRIIFSFILAPFFFYLIAEMFSLPGLKDNIVIFYIGLSVLVSLILFLISFIMVISMIINWFKNKNSYLLKKVGNSKTNIPEKQLKYRMKFFLPKLFGVIFVVYLNFTLSDEMWTITHGVNIYMKAAVIVIFLVFIYYFIKSTQFDSVRLSDEVKGKRTKSIMSAGLFYSFFGSILFNLMYGASMFKRNRGELTEVDAVDIYTIERLNNLIPFDISGWLESLKIILLNDLHLLPELLVFWMVQMFFIAIILEFFLQRERIVKRS
ncbi:MAG TPA: hypothetical protein VJ881_00555 [Halanaerobiales bacterium]|nr:hypothetical protein [Halanaerobiales bacterium]